jgi:hypothetical protein
MELHVIFSHAMAMRPTVTKFGWTAWLTCFSARKRHAQSPEAVIAIPASRLFDSVTLRIVADDVTG